MYRSYIFGVVVGILATALAILLFRKGLQRRMGAPVEGRRAYDERQLALRGSAYKAAFWALVGYLCVMGMTQALLGRSLFEPFVGEALGIIFAATVFVLHCVFHDAYFALNDKADYYIRLYTFLTVLEAVASIAAFLTGEPMIEDGRLNFRALTLAVMVMYIAIVPALLWKRKRCAGEEE